MLKHCQSAWCKDLTNGGSTVGATNQQNIKKAFDQQFPLNNRGSTSGTSDADSGICADNLSDGQVSPKVERRANGTVGNGYRPRSKSCCRRPTGSTEDPTLVVGDRRSRQMKVRFADQLEWSPSKQPQIPPTSSNTLARRMGLLTDPPNKLPPPYEVACQKLRQLDISKPPKGYYYSLAENYPRMSQTKSVEELCQPSVSTRISSYLYDSQETILADSSPAVVTPRQETLRCRYEDRVITAEPIAKIASSVYNKVSSHRQQTAVNAETLPRKRVSKESISRPFIDDMSFSVANRRIDVTVLSIDFKGIKVLLLKKTQPGPFGFYISTPDDKKLKGIYISNLSAVGLAPAINVGDRILEVNGATVKGKSLEEVQTWMTNRDELTLKLTPFRH